ncbi:hypothetical protein L6452_03541 [Arctium lappa]|uniref:Uncharacterized protein n=1 Tax=Arctium lappa TaxID=4217 RepID=A0ACB9FMM9_ARCLA|nr:hypothetical protein L6452_03541 [Arctium lappa]
MDLISIQGGFAPVLRMLIGFWQQTLLHVLAIQDQVLPRWVVNHELVLTTKEYMRQGNYNVNLTQKYAEDATSHPIIDEELWQQAVGGSKKGRTYGFGNTRDPNWS